MKSSWVILIIALGFLCSGSTKVYGQDPLFSQFHISKAYQNPALTGTDGNISLSTLVREQWGAIDQFRQFPGAFSTQFAAAEFSGSQLKNAFGLFVLRDVEGDGKLETQMLGMNYAYVVPFKSKHSLHNVRLGLGVFYNEKSIDWSKLLFSDQLDPKGPEYFAAQSAHAQYFDEFSMNTPKWFELNPGLVYRFNQKSYRGKGAQGELGLSFSHLISLASRSHQESLQGIATESNNKIVVHGTVFFPGLQIGSKGRRFTPFPAFRYEYQNMINTLTVGSRLMFMNLGTSLFYQNTLSENIALSTDALIVGFDMSWPVQKGQIVEIGLSYDLNLNGLNASSGGTMELSLKYHMRNNRSGKVVCPSVNRAHADRYENIWHKTIHRKHMKK